MLDSLERRGVAEGGWRVRAHPLVRRFRRDLFEYQTLLIDREGRMLGNDQVRRAGSCERERALLDYLWIPLPSQVRGRDDHFFCPHEQVHRPTYAQDRLAGDGPVGYTSQPVHLKCTEHGDGNVAAPDHGERLGAREVGSADVLRNWQLPGVDQLRVNLLRLRGGSGTDHTVLRMQEDLDAVGHVIGYERRKADAEVDHVPRLQVPRHPAGDVVGDCAQVYPPPAWSRNGFSSIPSLTSAFTRQSTYGCGVTTCSGSRVPASTISSASATTMCAAVAISGLKLRAVL